MGALHWAPSKPNSGISTRRRLARVPELPAVRHPAPYQRNRYHKQTTRRRDRGCQAYDSQTAQTGPDRAPQGNSDDRTTALKLACG
jgi:hypothetical protein